MHKIFRRIFFVIIIFSSVISLNNCTNKESEYRDEFKTIRESHPFIFPLAGEIGKNKTEFSGLAWYKNNLILLPQYPQLYKGDYDGAVFKIPKAAIDSCLSTQGAFPLTGGRIDMDFNGLDTGLLTHGSGFESVAFNGRDIFFTIESRAFFNTTGFLIKGRLSDDENIIKLLPETLVEIKSKVNISNLSEETIIIKESLIYCIYEGNGKNINSAPVVYVFDYNLKPLEELPFENIEYRITDATAPDSSGNVWVINYMWPDDKADLKPAKDEEFSKYGIGQSHKRSESVERLLELKIENDKVVRTVSPPIYVELDSTASSRNWEGIVRYKNGFLMVTDKYPETILGYIPAQN